MDLPSSKRRRTDAAAALSKPFKSPLRNRLPTNSNNISSTPIVPRSFEETQASLASTIHVESHLISDSRNLARPQAPPKRKRMPYLPAPVEHPDPEVLELQKQHRQIQSQVESLRTKLETATQALNLESSTKDIELQTLITKWRSVSQNAADEVFAGARERVTRMGGMAAWTEHSKRDAARWDFDEERHERDYFDEDEGETDGPCIGDSIEDLQSSKDGPEQGVGEGQDEEFTMKVMLKTLHVDPKLIGYDTKAQKWIKG